MDKGTYHVAQLGNILIGTTVTVSETTPTGDGGIYISPSKLREGSENSELAMSIRKRFGSRRFRRTRYLIDTLVYSCLSSRGYCVNHEVLRGVDIDLMLSIWEFIQTSTISSTPPLCSMLTRLCDGRSREGFEAMFGTRHRDLRVDDTCDHTIDDAEWVSVPVPEHKSIGTFEEAAFVDRVLASRLSLDSPGISTESLCLQTLQTL